MPCKAAVISGFGLNCEQETAHAIKQAGGEVELIHLNSIIDQPTLLENYNFLAFPGGFAHADHLGSAKVLSNKIKYKLKSELEKFAEEKKLIIGICNGFQVLVKMGLLPYPTFEQTVTLANNESGIFQDRWIRVKTNKESPCIFTKGIEYMDLPVRHGEGKFLAKDDATMLDILSSNLVVMQYVDSEGRLAGFPFNPNGSPHNIAGICDPNGRIFGLMPHPEAFNHYTNHPFWTKKGEIKPNGLEIFKNAVDYLK